jgi:hypothetical protein
MLFGVCVKEFRFLKCWSSRIITSPIVKGLSLLRIRWIKLLIRTNKRQMYICYNIKIIKFLQDIEQSLF